MRPAPFRFIRRRGALHMREAAWLPRPLRLHAPFSAHAAHPLPPFKAALRELSRPAQSNHCSFSLALPYIDCAEAGRLSPWPDDRNDEGMA